MQKQQQQLNSNVKIVYSLRVHTQLQLLGFKHIGMMPNPQDEKYSCWIYERTPEFMNALTAIIEGRDSI